MDSKKVWSKLRKPPKDALKKITSGRLGQAGMTDISPQWRLEAISDQFGLCGEGWKYDIVDLWTIDGAKGEVMCFAKVNFSYKENGGEWALPIPGIGGSKLIQLEKEGQANERLYNNDEGYKMAVTDALGTAMKCVGLAADVYLGNMDGSKYRDRGNSGNSQREKGEQKPPADPGEGAATKRTFVETIAKLKMQMKLETYNKIVNKYGEDVAKISNRKDQESLYLALVEEIAKENAERNAEVKEYFEIMKELKSDLGEEVYHESLRGIGMKNAASNNAAKNATTRSQAIDVLTQVKEMREKKERDIHY